MPAAAIGTSTTATSRRSTQISAAAAARSRTRRGYYRFRTVKPGAYPFRNFVNSWRPAHIHFSVFGTGFAQRLITQMYFEGDPLIPHDAIAHTIPDAGVARLVAPLDMNAAVPLDCLAYRFDIVLRGRRSTLLREQASGKLSHASALPYLPETPSQTAGPYVHIGLIPHQAGFDIFENNFSNVLVDARRRASASASRAASSTGSARRRAT